MMAAPVKPLKNILMVVPLVLAAMMPLASFAQSKNDLIAALNSKIVPIKTLSPNDDLSDLQFLKKSIKNKKVFALGEAAHGVHEFFEMKQWLLEFLVQELGVRYILTETDFAGTQTMNDYVLHGKGGAYQGLTAMASSVWTTQEFVEMAEWVKKYNDTQPDKDKVHFYGFDIINSHNTAKLLPAYLTATNQLTPALQQGFAAMDKNIGKLTDDDRSAIKNTAELLKSAKFTQPDTTEANFYKRMAFTVGRYAQYVSTKTTAAENGELREKFIAENISWIYNHIGGGKMLLWGHSEHLSKTMNSSGLHRAGILLNDLFKDDYYVFGLCFNSGRIHSIDSKNGGYADFDVPPVTMANNSDNTFAQCKYPNFILDFKKASTNPIIKAYLNQPVYSYFIGSNYASKANTPQMYIEHKWADGYDAIVFIRNVIAAMAVKQ